MKNVLYLALLLMSSLLHAQGALAFQEDSTLNAQGDKFQFYVSPGYSVHQFVETGASFVRMQLGINYNRNFDIGIYYSRIIDSFQKQIIFPASHQYDQSNIGLALQYSFLAYKIRPHFGIGGEYATASWKPLNDSNDTFVDHIILYNAFIGASWRIGELLTLQVNGGYNFVDKVELVGLESEDYNGFKFDVLLKVRMLSF